MKDIHPSYLLISLAVWLFLHRTNRSWAPVMIIASLPSTALHEAAHYAAAFFLGCHPSLPSLIPSPEGRGWRLGSVNASVTWFSALPVALAPLYIAPAFYFFEPHLHISQLWKAVLLPFVLRACTPSSTDWKVAFSTIGGTLFWLAASGAAILLFCGRWVIPS